MSNVNVNGNTYNGVTSVKLMKADGSGYAEYKEGAETTDTLLAQLIANDGTSLGDITSDEAAPCLEWMTGSTFGDVSFPYATQVRGGCARVTADNLLLPNVTTFAAVASGNSSWRGYGFNNSVISGTLDLSSLESALNYGVVFTGAQIGTLKLGSYMPMKSFAQGSSFTNVVWYGFAAPGETNSFWAYMYDVQVTNLYVPADQKAAVQAKIDAGALAKITNLYTIDEWEE